MTAEKPKNIIGQGLLEVIVALGIITSGIIGMLSLALSNQNSSGEAAARLVAVNLAREALEVARGRRDGNWLSAQNWDAGLGSGLDYTAALFFDADNNAWGLNFTPDDFTHDFTKVWRQRDVVDPNIAILRQAEFVIIPDNVEATPYRRLLTLDPICETGIIISSGSSCPGVKIGLRAQASVSWDFKGRQRNVVLEERIFDWR